MYFNAQCDTIISGDNMILETIGYKVKFLREIKGISQTELSKKTGVVREQISRIENGQINATIQTMHKLSVALDVPLRDFFDIEDIKSTSKYVRVKPFIKWAGGKTQLLEEIKKFLPDKYETYYEPFLGGGALFFELMPDKAILSDFNKDLITAYNSFKDTNMYTLLVNEIIKHQNNHSEEYYYYVREMDRKENYINLPDYVKAARLIYLNKACFNGLYRVNSRGYFNVPSGKKEIVKVYNQDLFDSIHEYLSNNNIKFLSDDFEKVVSSAKKNDFVYLDPPYDPYEDHNSFTTYTKDNFGKDEQLRLSKVFKDLDKKGVKVMLSNHNTKYINELYKGFNINIVKAKRMINSNPNGRGFVEEVIITNY